ncbi:DUF2490 domain-containing protein [Kordia algicida OT-1]|uniref:DUF2490 domain-containing protein n=1 Tax=Kordia algicida OT-1 TaxID=391587 RepID=A9DL16_9FLAO|nr:DUF2490 domain-containing protein [Kordia algicida]EDP98454.1 hypothetical protein KAOT1_14592 [Kordia algicida OT-1]
MTTFYTRFYIAFAIFLCSYSVCSQNDFTIFFEPSFAVNHKVNDSYKVNFSTVARNYVYRDDEFEFTTRQLQFVHFSTYSFNSNHSLSGGIMYRFRENFEDRSNELRLTQQYNYAERPNIVRFGHRFRSEQRITTNNTVHRFRYRFTIDFPLSGEKLDIGEAYFVANAESLLSVVKADAPQIDQRFTTQIGWQWTENLKFQTGLEYRFENYNQTTQEILFILTSVILKI